MSLIVPMLGGGGGGSSDVESYVDVESKVTPIPLYVGSGVSLAIYTYYARMTRCGRLSFLEFGIYYDNPNSDSGGGGVIDIFTVSNDSGKLTPTEKSSGSGTVSYKCGNVTYSGFIPNGLSGNYPQIWTYELIGQSNGRFAVDAPAGLMTDKGSISGLAIFINQYEG